MKYTFAEIQTHYANKRGFVAFSDMKSHLQTSAKNQINELYNGIWYHKQYGFAGDKLQVTTVPPYTTGTVSGTAGGRTLTGSSTAWPSYVNGIPLRGQYVVLSNKTYKILKVISTTSIMLEGQLTEDIAAGSSYGIYFIEYALRNDYGAFRDAKLDEAPLFYKPESITPIINEVGVPNIIYNAGHQKFDAYSFTGTLTLGSNQITSISGVTLDDSLVGKALTHSTLRDIYYIIDVDSTKIYLDRIYQNSTATGTTILINPTGTPLVGFKPFPTGRNLVVINYTYAPSKLVGDNDYTLLPTDTPLLVGVELLGTQWETVGDGNVNEVIFQNKRFIDSLKVLNFRGTPLQNRLYSMNESHNRIIKRGTNPWNR